MDSHKILLDAHNLALSAQNDVLALFKKHLGQANVISSVGKDIKLEADLAISELLIKKLSPSGYKVITEENPGNNIYPDEYYWLVDPLDGSLNFSRGFPFYCCSIALIKGQKPLYGNILNLVDGTMIYGGIHLSSGLTLGTNKELTKSVLLTGFPLEFNFNEQNNNVLKFYSQFKKVRMIGSAASSLSLVAKGIFDLYYEKNIYFWDVAAGLAIIKASDGNYNIKFESNSWRVTVAAGNKHLTSEINI